MHAGRRGDDGPWRVALLALQPQPAVRGDAEPRERGGREREVARSRPGRRRRVGVRVRGPVSPAGEGDRVVDQRQAARVRAAAAHGRLEAGAMQTKS